MATLYRGAPANELGPFVSTVAATVFNERPRCGYMRPGSIALYRQPSSLHCTGASIDIKAFTDDRLPAALEDMEIGLISNTSGVNDEG